MIFRQMFDAASGTYSYLLASRRGGEALIIDPVLEKVGRYIELLNELDLRLLKAIDTHMHADHVTGLGALRERTQCITVMGEQTKAEVVSMRINDGDEIDIDGLSLGVIHTPGHTDDSYSFTMADRVFTGDTLLIRGTGRTGFQNGDPRAQYESIFNRLLKLPEQTLVYPAHDYKGETVSTIGEEKAFNPRLQVQSVEQYVDLMNNLKLPNPKMMDVAVPANTKIGLSQGEVARRGWAITTAEFAHAIDRPDVAIVDIRETSEQEQEGHHPPSFARALRNARGISQTRGVLHQTGVAKRLIFICTFGERSATAVQLAQALASMGRATSTVALQSGGSEIKAREGRERHREYLWGCDLFRSLRHEFDPLDREILERAFDATLAVIGDDGARAILHNELIEIAHLIGLSDPETLRDLLLARLPQIRPAPGAG